MSDLVSVVVPVYRVEAYLPACIDSLLAQTYRNLDIILVDDGSPDRCGEICDDYAERDSRVRVVHQANAGLSGARNAGLRIARGDLVAFVDSDDWVHEEYIETLCRILRDHDADVALCNFLWMLGDDAPPVDTRGEVRALSPREALALFDGPLAMAMAVAWGKVYRRELFSGIEYPVGKTHEDDYTTHLLLSRARRVVLTSATLYNYRLRPGSIMAEHGLANLRDQGDSLVRRAQFLYDAGLDRVAAAQLRKAFNVLRRVRRALPADDPAAAQIAGQLRWVATRLRRTGRPWPLRIFAAAYLWSPATMDRIHDLYGTAKNLVVRPSAEGHQLLSVDPGSKVTPPACGFPAQEPGPRRGSS